MDFIRLSNFEGPLDLLLHLVKDGNTNIFDINIVEITDKYLNYIKNEESLNINVSSEYLVMAAELMYLKSKSLLPMDNSKEEDDTDVITKENLINRLLEYQRYKEITGKFKELEKERKEIYIKGPEKIREYTSEKIEGEASVEDLLNAFKSFLERQELDKPLETTITKKEYSVRERKSGIRNILKDKKKVYLDELIEEFNKPYIVVTFLSILEMVKERDVIIFQNKNFDKILVELRDM